MSEIAEFLKVIQEQMRKQEERHKQQLALMQQQMEDTRKAGGTMEPQHQTPPFPAFDSTTELWKDYLLRFETFVNANSVPDEKKALVFLTNQTSGTYKLITNYALQQDIPTTANSMIYEDIEETDMETSCRRTWRHRRDEHGDETDMETSRRRT